VNYYLWFEYELNNNGFRLETHWVDMSIPSRTLYLALGFLVGYKIYKKVKVKIGG
jgi:hypothetical protein